MILITLGWLVVKAKITAIVEVDCLMSMECGYF